MSVAMLGISNGVWRYYNSGRSMERVKNACGSRSRCYGTAAGKQGNLNYKSWRDSSL